METLASPAPVVAATTTNQAAGSSAVNALLSIPASFDPFDSNPGEELDGDEDLILSRLRNSASPEPRFAGADLLIANPDALEALALSPDPEVDPDAMEVDVASDLAPASELAESGCLGMRDVSNDAVEPDGISDASNNAAEPSSTSTLLVTSLGDAG
jgi:hypothetical protein